MSNKGKETESTTKKVERLAREIHSDVRYITSGTIEGSKNSIEYAVATNRGLFYYLLKNDKLTPLDQILWQDVKEIKVDYLAMRTNLTLNGQNYRLVNDGKKIFALAEEKSNAKVEKVNRKWHQKILGFRSGTRWKKIVAIIGYLLIFGFIGSMLSDPEKTESGTSSPKEEVASTNLIEKEPEEKEPVSTPLKKSEEEKAAELEASKKADEKKAAAAEAEEVQKAADEKDYYTSEIQTKVDTQMDMYDEAWDSLWIATFEGIDNGTVDVYTAYENMKQLEQRYETLQSSVPAIPDEKLSKEHKELLTEFRDGMSSASMWRASAAEKAQEMFDTGDVSPSVFDDVKADVEMADGQMLSAIVSLTSLEAELGIERPE